MHFSIPFYDFDHLHHPNADNIINIELIRHYCVLPIQHDKTTLTLGMADPTDQTSMSIIEFHTGLRVTPMLVHAKKLEKWLTAQLRLDSTLDPVLDPVIDNRDEKVIDYVNRLLDEARVDQISDIHLEPYANFCRIRLRRDGQLFEFAQIRPDFAERIMTRLKILANLNIAERRQPQDGRLDHAYQAGNREEKFDIRINTCPTLFGEKMVLRILNANKKNLHLKQLGLSTTQLAQFREALTQPQGLILVTGPTGCGKTSTLYAALNELNHIEKNICTVEDPIEIELAGINQVNIMPKLGLNFATILRTFLRQDPDILMIGEIRDSETATIALQAAQTGHLVLSTLHTNSAIESISRLKMMDIAPHHLVGALSLIIAQRLVRVLCTHCKEAEHLPTSIRNRHPIFAEMSDTYHPRGCDACHQGYKGRTALFEMLPITPALNGWLQSAKNSKFRNGVEQAVTYDNLCASGLDKVKLGITSLGEVSRVLGMTHLNHLYS